MLTFMSLMHKLEKLVHHSLQELPVRLQEPRVLSDDVHDVGRANRLVILSALRFGEGEQILDDLDQESLLGVLAYAAVKLTGQPLR